MSGKRDKKYGRHLAKALRELKKDPSLRRAAGAPSQSGDADVA